MIRLACPSCGHKLILKDEYAGKRGVCPHCKQRLIVPATNLVGAETVSLASPLADLDGEALDFLAPPQGPGELGRLGTYRILKLLGAGGMGLVLHAEDLVLKRAVALKVMRPELAKSKDARQRFLREARAIAAIEHRHIVAVYQVAEDRGVPFLAMPFLKGESLEERLQRERKLSVADSVCIGRQIAEGLAAAHKNELVHRDIKPGNIWLETQDDPRQPRAWVKLLDFGLARAAAGDDMQLTKTGTILGTPAYMAPEQARAEKVDARCDLFSLGAVLYRMLTGTLPFKGKDTMSQLMSLAADTPRPVREVNSDVPPPLADLVTQLLAKEPDGRPPSARVVADALAALEENSTRSPDSAASKRPFTPDERAIPEGPTRMYNPAATPPTARGGTQRPRWLVPLAASGGLLGLLAVVLIFAWGSTEKPADSSQASKTPTTQPFPERAKATSNSIGMKFAWCPPGTFQMGSPPSEAERSSNETQHKVTLTKGFYLGTHEVTQAQWRAVIGNNPSNFKGDNLPVDKVSWKECQEFCTKLGQLDGKRYRLPTEAEWEYACRAGSTTAYFFGDDTKQFGDFAWYNANAEHKTHEVGTKEPNAWGLYDMHGNVWEWCQDGYGPYPPGDLRDPQGSNNEDARVLRGGSWHGGPRYCRAAFRHWPAPAPGDRLGHFGCRVALCLD